MRTMARVSTRLAISLAMLLAMLLASANACSLLVPYSFEVVAWSPGQERIDEAGGIIVGVEFSREADRPSSESAFSLSVDGEAVLGAFSWLGARMGFTPYAPLRDGADYELRVGTGAMDQAGVSLERAFEARFSTKAERSRPRFVSSDPPDGGRMVGELGTLTLEFDEAIDPIGFRSSLSIAPRARGSWRLVEGGRRIEFRPTEPWARSVDYTCEADAGLRDEEGNEIGRSVVVRFVAGLEGVAPEVTAAAAVDAEGEVVALLEADEAEDGAYTLNRGWESRWRLRMDFSEPVELAGLASALACDSGPKPLIETIGAYSASVLWRFDEPPEWNGVFTLRVESGVEDQDGDSSDSDIVYRIVADGPGSRPPRFVGLRLPLAPGAEAADRELAAFALDEPFSTLAIAGGDGRYPIGVPTGTSIELYLELAEGASIDLLSTMGAFSFSATNGSLEFDALRVVAGGFDYAEPHPAWSGLDIVRIDGSMTNRADCGLVTFSLDGGYADSWGNAAKEDQCLSLQK